MTPSASSTNGSRRIPASPPGSLGCTLDGRLLGCGPKDHLVRVPAGAGWALVGDASLHQDPWTGNGMDNAGVHATFLAEAIDDWLSGRRPEDEALAGYLARRDDHAMAGFPGDGRLGSGPPSARNCLIG